MCLCKRKKLKNFNFIYQTFLLENILSDRVFSHKDKTTMPKRKRKEAGLGNRKKGYWKKNNKPNNSNNDSVNSNSNKPKVRTEIENICYLDETNLISTNENDEATTHTDDKNVVEADEIVQKYYLNKLKNVSRRWTVFELFMYKYNGLEPPNGDYYSYWTGRNGLVTKIRKDLNIKGNSGYKLVPIFEQILECERSETDFHPRMLETRGGKKPVMIKVTSPEAQIVADCIESGLSWKKTWKTVNLHRAESCQELLSMSSIVSVLRRLRPKIRKIQKRKQGSTDPSSPWASARKLWCTQLLTRFGELKDELPRPLQRKFDPDETGHLDLHQVVWWDETHRKCLIGGLSSSKDYHIEFPRNEEGKIQVEDGKYLNKKISRLNVKYEKECRMGLGCAMVAPLDDDGCRMDSVGRRCKLFSYTGKVLISLSDYQKMKSIEIDRVRKHTSASSKWIEKRREEGKVYANEKVTKLKKCGNVTARKLKTVGIETVQHLKDIPDPDCFVLPTGLPKSTFKLVWTHAKEASCEDVPEDLDHRKEANPYLSRYGNDWETHIKKSPTFNNSVLITDYIQHIMDESARVMKGTAFEDNWMIYHDALTLMTAKETKRWMEQKGFLRRWILPTHDLYDNLPVLKNKYGTNPIGNSPEFMPWDAHLNSDVHAALDHHVLVSKHLDDSDERKFDASTPKKMLAAYRRILDPSIHGVCPPSRRILEDVRRVILAMQMVVAADGCLIEDDNIRSGRRYESGTMRNSNWGGKRTKNDQSKYSPDDYGLHEDLLAVREAQIRASLSHFDDGNALLPLDDESSKSGYKNQENENNENDENIELTSV